MDKRGNFLALCLLDALEDENLQVSKDLLTKYEASPYIIIQGRGIASIHYACGMDNIKFAEEILPIMLTKEGEINVCTDDGMTPLHVSSFYGRTNIVKMLLEKGGDIDMRDEDNKTPILYAVYEEHFEVVKVIQNFIFEKKFKKKKNQICNKNVLRSPQKNDVPEKNKDINLLNNNLLQVKALEEKKFTPNRINYNFDATSPYYINITHRRKPNTSIIEKKAEEDFKILSPTQVAEINENPMAETNENPLAENNEIPVAETNEISYKQSPVRKNLFKLTEDNLHELSEHFPPEKSRISIINSWREKVQKSKNRKSIIQKFNDIDSMLSGFMQNENLNFTNTILIQNDDQVEHLDVPSKAFSRTSFGKMLVSIQNTKSPDDSFLTANSFTNSNLSESNFLSSPKNDQIIVQMSEAYVHTDTESGLVFYETKLLTNPTKKKDSPGSDVKNSTFSTHLTYPLDYDTETLRAELTCFGEPPGPITKSTKKLYIKKLIKYKRNPERMTFVNSQKYADNDNKTLKYSLELQKTVSNPDKFLRINDDLSLEKEISSYFKKNQGIKKMREGHLKQSFIYFLIDPRVSCNLPGESVFMENHKVWTKFLQSIFYVGKGKSVRPYSHLYEAMKTYSRKHAKAIGIEKDNNADKTDTFNNLPRSSVIELFKSPRTEKENNKKLERILEIWADGKGVVCLHVFHNILPIEAYTREAAIIDALGVSYLTNIKRGDYYGPAQTWTMRNKKCLGIVLLLKSLQIYLAEGESQLSPSDLI